MTRKTAFPRPPDSEPADPCCVDTEARRNVRIAPPEADVTCLPKSLIECGCGSCPDAVDPLDDASRNQFARENCPDPQPVTMRRAREAYLCYQRSATNGGEYPSSLQDTRTQHGRLLDAERQVLDRMTGPTLLLLSLRLSPVESANGDRYWVHPTRLDERLHDAWEPVKKKLRRRLSEFNFEYVAVTAPTRKAATPHKHVLVYVEDPENEVGIEVAQSAVESHVNNCKGAYEEDHPVEKAQSDAGIVLHNPPAAEKTDHHDSKMPPNTVQMKYVADQRPHWVIENVDDGTSDINEDNALVDGGAIAWASRYDWLSSSRGFSLTQ